MARSIKSFFTNSLVYALASIVLGILMLIMQGAMVSLIVKVFAVVLIAYGAVTLVGYFTNKGRKSTTSLGIGILAVCAGVFFLIFPEVIINLFPIIVGVMVVLEGVTNVVGAFRGRKKNWFINIIIGVLIIAVGLFLIFRAGTVIDVVVIIAGIALIINGLSYLFMTR